MSELDRYDYTLPRDLIAQQPLPVRSDARLMIADRAAQSLSHRHIRDLPDLLRPRDCLVINDTRIVPAQLIGERDLTGGHWEGLFLSADAQGNWQLLCKSRGKLQPGESITAFSTDRQRSVRLKLVEKQPGGVWMARPESQASVWDLLDDVGNVPLPNYIRGGRATPADAQRYQTVFARAPGAVAAPTAGLHFTKELVAKLLDAGLSIARVTLHVGLGTFRPITADTLGEHQMHNEWGQLLPEEAQRINDCRAAGGRVIAVGTTVVRVLETAAATGSLQAWSGQTSLFIRPPYEFRAVDALLTNFHLPRTTLLVLVRTFGGDDLVMRAYDEAIKQQYRFYSYGDAMLIV
jgi:S-adenosylmethionine:tRNA ribosyltransferase-isomerase